MKIAVDIDDTLNVVDRITRAAGYIARKNLPYKLVNPHAQLLDDVFDWSREDVIHFIKEGGVSVFTEAEARPYAKETLARWRKEGHQVIILTSRPKELFTNPVLVSRDWLQKRKIEYDEIVADCANKTQYCVEHGVDVIIDNNVDTCVSAQNAGVNAVLVVAKATVSRAGEVRYIGENWKRIAQIVEELAQTRKR